MAGEATSERRSRFFFLHLGTLVGLLVYFVVFDGSGRSPVGLRTALLAALAVHTLYVAIAWRLRELKQADFGFWLFYAVGLAGILAGSAPLTRIYLTSSAPAVFAVFALSALLPPLFGRQPFTFHYMRRALPAWQMRMPLTQRIGRVMWLYWVGIFAACVLIALRDPADPRWTALYPNLLIFGVGVTAAYWLPPLYLRIFPPGPPEAVEAAILGLPFVFNASAAPGLRAEIHFVVSGPEAAEYRVRIADGACEAHEGRSASPDLTIYTPGGVWLGIARGEIDGEQALADGRYRFTGDGDLLGRLPRLFPRGGGA